MLFKWPPLLVLERRWKIFYESQLIGVGYTEFRCSGPGRVLE